MIPRRRASRVTLAASLGLATALLASACSSSSSAAPPSKGPELTHLTVGVLPITDDAPVFIALKNGYFKQQGLTVTTKIIDQSTAAVPDMVSGTVDIVGGGNYVSFFSGISLGTMKVRAIAPAAQCAKNNLDIMVLPKSHITSPAGLVGKTVAVNINPNIQTLTINAVLKADNINPAKIHYTAIPFPNMPSALASGSVDAIATVEPFITGVEEASGAVPLLDECQGPTANLPISGYFATASWVQKYPKTALAFQKAIEEAQAAADSNRKLVQEVLPTYTKITSKAAALISLPNYPTTLDTTQLQRVADLMYSGGLLKAPLSVKPIVYH